MEARPDPLAGAARVLVVSAHPDDETLGAGRLVAGHAGPVVALTLTAGENCLAGHDVDPVDVGDAPARRVALRGGGAGRRPARHAALGGRLARGARGRRGPAAAAADRSPATCCWRRGAGTPTRDHRAAGRAAREAGEAAGIAVVEYPVWAPYLRTPHQVQETGQQLVPVEAGAAATRAWRRALGQYLSQLQPWQPGWAPLVPAGPRPAPPRPARGGACHSPVGVCPGAPGPLFCAGRRRLLGVVQRHQFSRGIGGSRGWLALGSGRRRRYCTALSPGR